MNHVSSFLRQQATTKTMKSERLSLKRISSLSGFPTQGVVLLVVAITKQACKTHKNQGRRAQWSATALDRPGMSRCGISNCSYNLLLWYAVANGVTLPLGKTASVTNHAWCTQIGCSIIVLERQADCAHNLEQLHSSLLLQSTHVKHVNQVRMQSYSTNFLIFYDVGTRIQSNAS